MLLGVNAVRLTRPFTGVGRYLECLLDEWSRMPLPFARVVLYAPAPIDPGRVLFPLAAFEQEIGGPGGPDPVWEARFLSPRAREIDVLFAPSYTLPLGYRGRTVVTNHGPSQNRPLDYEWWRSLAYEALYRHSARRADAVVTVSDAVRRRVMDRYGVARAKVTVAFNAASRLFVPVVDRGVLARVTERYAGTAGPFALFVGKLSRRHSIPDLIAAFALARRRSPGHRLVLAGPNSLGLDLAGIARRHGVADAVIHHPFVDHRDLPALYSAAQEMVYPATEAEGFGIPVLEAMACGTPVLSTARGAIPEVAGDAALLVPSSSVSDLSWGLERILADAELRGRLSERGRARSAAITWRRSAERVLGVLETVARGGAAPPVAPRA